MEATDTSKKLNEWLLKMGFEGKIPSNLKPICNPCTALIWEQLIQIVKPKQEIEHIRNNVLINRLLKNDEACLNSSISFLKIDRKSSMKEIEAWNKKKMLESRLCVVRDELNENKAKLKNMLNNNKIKYVNLENVKQKLTENQQHTFLLNKKAQQIELEISKVDEMLTLARNLTPVEDEEQNKPEVLETLKMCSEKLEKIVENQIETQQPCRMNPLTSESIFEQKTPHNKIFKSRRAFSSRKKCVIFSSTKIINQTKLRPKLDDSLGLLDEFSMTFDSTGSSVRDLNFSNANLCYDIAILNDKKLNDLVEDALYKYNRYMLWNILFESNKHCKAQLIDMIVNDERKTSSVSTVHTIDKNRVLMKLYAMHVDYELKTRKTFLNVRKLQNKINGLQKGIFATLTSLNASSQVINHLKLQQMEIGLNKGIEYVHEAVNAMQSSIGKQSTLEVFKETVLKLEENINSKVSAIEYKYNAFKQIFDLMTQARNETCTLVRKLGQFTVDFDWTLPLNSNLSSREVETFLEFPLEYNRTVTAREKTTFLRELPLNYIPYQDDLDSNSLHMLVAILQNPCSPAEILLLDIVRRKLKMNQYKSLIYLSKKVENKGYKLDELRSQESYIDYALEKLNALISSPSSNEATNILKNIKEVVNLWIEMPLKNCISEKRLFNGLPYSYYEKLYENFYRQL